MTDARSSNHSVWECKYHVVWIPKCRRKQLHGQVAKYHGEVFHELARHQESRILEGHLCPDHVHMLIAIPPKLRWTAEKFYGAKFLGSRILRVNDWSE